VVEAAGFRLDRYVAERLGLLSRSQVKARNLRARVNGREARLSRLLKPGDTLELDWDEEAPRELIPEDLPLDVLYEDDRVIVVNKAQGMVTHPGAGNRSGTLAHALLARSLARGRAAPGGEAGRPCIVHRLDKDTSGALIAAWDEEALEFLAAQFRARTVRKTYAALVRGTPDEAAGRVETWLARDPRDRKRFAVSPPGRGRLSLTFYRVLRAWGAHSLLLLRPRTGRTHQLRVHLRHLGHPIIGDPLYGRPDSRFPRATLMLHARSLTLTLPGAIAPTRFKAPLPARFTAALRELGEEGGESRKWKVDGG
jgi:23S rRNA pseudouridine1911/1915/1917 synthase